MHSNSWHVLHVLSNHEKRVAQHLVVRSVEHYLPLFTERVKWTDRTVVTERPLFSGYVFARFAPESRISVISTPGVLHSLGDEERNMVRDEELAKIRRGLANGLSLRPQLRIAVGTPVRVRAGTFAGAEGIATELRKQCRIIISLSTMHQAFSLEVGIGDLVVLSRPAGRPGLNAIPAYGF